MIGSRCCDQLTTINNMNGWLPLTRELIQSNIIDMDLDPDSLLQAHKAFASAGMT